MSLGLGARSGLCFFLLVFGELVQQTLADSATCQPGWEWASNSMNQNPCDVAGDLNAQCGNFSSFTLSPLAPGSYYEGPQSVDVFGQECNCNTVVYSLYMACTGCQNDTIQRWSTWGQYCQTPGPYITEYPGTIPSTTAIPPWAYLNCSMEDIFDPALAKAASGQGSISPSNTPSSRPTGPSKKEPAHVGAIVGGVIGGLAVFVVTGVGTWIFLRRRAMVDDNGDDPDYTKASTGTPPLEPKMLEQKKLPSLPRLYDPSDPSTYPDDVSYVPGMPYTVTVPPSGYTGAPEL